MKKLWLAVLLSTVLLNGCSRCGREQMPPPPEVDAPPVEPNPELPREGEPATPAFPDGSQSGEGSQGEGTSEKSAD